MLIKFSRAGLTCSESTKVAIWRGVQGKNACDAREMAIYALGNF